MLIIFYYLAIFIGNLWFYCFCLTNHFFLRYNHNNSVFGKESFMKTTDLIPILLYELKTGDKYGLEIVEAIKNASNSQIEIKQPTLYPLLKKLEKSKFISSYWQDSEIGGKRHYYKITENGLVQLDTYPPLETLIENALKEDEDVFSVTNVEDKVEQNAQPFTQNKSPSPFDNIFAKPQNVETNSTIYPTYSIESEQKSQQENDIEDDVNADLCEEKSESMTENYDFHTQNNTNDDTDEMPAQKVETSNLSDDFGDNNLETNDFASDSTTYSVFDGLKYADEHIEENNAEQNEQPVISTDETSQNLNSISPTNPVVTSQNNSLDIFDALSFADEDNTNDTNSGNQPIDSEMPIIDKQQTNVAENLVLENPFFKDNDNKTIDEKTALEINQDNARLISKDAGNTNFANEKSIKRFTEKPILPATDFVKDKTKNLFNENNSPIAPKLNTVATDVEYRDYIDYKNNEKIVKAKKQAKCKLIKILTSSLLTLLVLSLLLVVCIKNKLTPLFVLAFIGTTLYVVLYSCKFIGEYNTIRLQIDSANKQYNFKKQILYRSVVFAGIIVILLIANFAGLKQGKLFGANNFGNFIAPILLSLMLFVDYLLSYVFYKLLKK